ncbi:MAG: inorganic phosphate transporter [Terriglobales bacterium]
MDKLFRRGQLLSAALLSLAHGTNDAQKIMDIIATALVCTASRRCAGASPAASSGPGS